MLELRVVAFFIYVVFVTLVLKKALALTNLFLIKFNHRVDRKNGLEGCPWVVNRHALLLSEIDSSVALIDQVVNNMKIFIRILNFPCENHILEAASAIGANFGQFLDLPGSIRQQVLEPILQDQSSYRCNSTLEEGFFCGRR